MSDNTKLIEQALHQADEVDKYPDDEIIDPDVVRELIAAIQALEAENIQHHRTCEVLGTKLARAEEELRRLRER